MVSVARVILLSAGALLGAAVGYVLWMLATYYRAVFTTELRKLQRRQSFIYALVRGALVGGGPDQSQAKIMLDVSRPTAATAAARRHFEPFAVSGMYTDGSPCVVIADADAVRPVFTNEELFQKHPADAKAFEKIIKDSLVISRGALWRRQRRLLTPLFHLKQLHSYDAALALEAHAICSEMAAAVARGAATVDVVPPFTSASLRAVIRTAFGGAVDPVDFAGKFTEFLGLAESASLNFAFFSPSLVRDRVPTYARFTTLMQQMRVPLRRAIADTRRRAAAKAQEQGEADGADGGGGSSSSKRPMLPMLEQLVMARDPETGEAIEDELIIDEAITFLLAGQVTTATTLSWMTHHLARRPELYAALRQEALGAASDADADPATGVVVLEPSALPLARRVANETLRLHPPAPVIIRRLAADTTMATGDGKYTVRLPAGTTIMPNIAALQRDPTHWGDDAESFRPERWLDTTQRRHPYQFTAFSAGSRSCIGQKLAMNELVVIIATFARRFTTLAPAYEHVEQNIGTTAPKALPMRLGLSDGGD